MKNAKKSGLKFRGIVKVHPGHLKTLAVNKAAGAKIAAGFTSQQKLDMTFHGGRTIRDLAYKSFYLGGQKWSDSDVQNIDHSLSAAMSDAHLNNVMQQYYSDSKPITTRFLGSTRVSGTVNPTFNRDRVNTVLQTLLDDGSLSGVDFDNTIICLFLPPGIVLTTDAAGGVGKSKLKGDDDEDSSQEGLGGYHGSCHLGTKRIYFAVGVYSERTGNSVNGIPVWPEPWKNVVATFYHELCEARTDPDVEDAIRKDDNKLLGWYADVDDGGEIGDIPMNEAGQNLNLVMIEVPLVKGGSAPIQLMWSNQVHGPQGPFA